MRRLGYNDGGGSNCGSWSGNGTWLRAGKATGSTPELEPRRGWVRRPTSEQHPGQIQVNQAEPQPKDKPHQQKQPRRKNNNINPRSVPTQRQKRTAKPTPNPPKKQKEKIWNRHYLAVLTRHTKIHRSVYYDVCECCRGLSDEYRVEKLKPFRRGAPLIIEEGLEAVHAHAAGRLGSSWRRGMGDERGDVEKFMGDPGDTADTRGIGVDGDVKGVDDTKQVTVGAEVGPDHGIEGKLECGWDTEEEGAVEEVKGDVQATQGGPDDVIRGPDFGFAQILHRGRVYTLRYRPLKPKPAGPAPRVRSRRIGSLSGQERFRLMDEKVSCLVTGQNWIVVADPEDDSDSAWTDIDSDLVKDY